MGYSKKQQETIQNKYKQLMRMMLNDMAENNKLTLSDGLETTIKRFEGYMSQKFNNELINYFLNLPVCVSNKIIVPDNWTEKYGQAKENPLGWLFGYEYSRDEVLENISQMVKNDPFFIEIDGASSTFQTRRNVVMWMLYNIVSDVYGEEKHCEKLSEAEITQVIQNIDGIFQLGNLNKDRNNISKGTDSYNDENVRLTALYGCVSNFLKIPNLPKEIYDKLFDIIIEQEITGLLSCSERQEADRERALCTQSLEEVPEMLGWFERYAAKTDYQEKMLSEIKESYRVRIPEIVERSQITQQLEKRETISQMILRITEKENINEVTMNDKPQYISDTGWNEFVRDVAYSNWFFSASNDKFSITKEEQSEILSFTLKSLIYPSSDAEENYKLIERIFKSNEDVEDWKIYPIFREVESMQSKRLPLEEHLKQMKFLIDKLREYVNHDIFKRILAPFTSSLKSDTSKDSERKLTTEYKQDRLRQLTTAYILEGFFLNDLDYEESDTLCYSWNGYLDSVFKNINIFKQDFSSVFAINPDLELSTRKTANHSNSDFNITNNVINLWRMFALGRVTQKGTIRELPSNELESRLEFYAISLGILETHLINSVVSSSSSTYTQRKIRDSFIFLLRKIFEKKPGLLQEVPAYKEQIVQKMFDILRNKGPKDKIRNALALIPIIHPDCLNEESIQYASELKDLPNNVSVLKGMLSPDVRLDALAYGNRSMKCITSPDRYIDTLNTVTEGNVTQQQL